ncbi:ribosomal protein L7/L12 [Streptomyces sp. NBC_00211]|uniref:ribosomal protein L7/L12 n=1 Tax=Streptomyces sp. NBC_00211 TaxID=2975683 RepID=UPI002F915B5F
MEEPGFRVLLRGIGERKMDTLKAIRKLTGFSLWESKELAERAPTLITEVNWIEVADQAAETLKKAGASVTVVCDWCDRETPPETRPIEPGPCKGPWPAGTCRASNPPLAH